MKIGRSSKYQSGFSYIVILFVIAISSVLLAKTGIDWSQAAQREKERELLFIGNQYRQAIALYYERTPGAVKRYPAKLEDLISDSRFPSRQHYLRKHFLDPMTNQAHWGIISAPEGGIMGIYSLSEAPPIKSHNFGYVDQSMKGAKKYSEWRFEYIPSQFAN